MFEQLNMTKKLKRQISKAVSIALSAAMLVTGLPAEVTGGVASVKAATVAPTDHSGTNVDDVYSQDAEWTTAANGKTATRTTKWDFNAGNLSTSLTLNSTTKAYVHGIKYKEGSVKYSKDSAGFFYLSIKNSSNKKLEASDAMVAIPLDLNTESVFVQFSLYGNTNGRLIGLGNSEQYETIAHNPEHATLKHVTSYPTGGKDSNNNDKPCYQTWDKKNDSKSTKIIKYEGSDITYLATEENTIDGETVKSKWLYIRVGDETAGSAGETKFMDITITETKSVTGGNEGGGETDPPGEGGDVTGGDVTGGDVTGGTNDGIDEGTYSFVGKTEKPTTKGLTFIGNIKFFNNGNNEKHGFQAEDANAALELKLKKKATIVVTACCYGPGTVKCNNETVMPVNDATIEKDGDKVAKVYTFEGVSDKATLTFGAGTYIHKLSVTYQDEGGETDPNPGTNDGGDKPDADGFYNGFKAKNAVEGRSYTLDFTNIAEGLGTDSYGTDGRTLNNSITKGIFTYAAGSNQAKYHTQGETYGVEFKETNKLTFSVAGDSYIVVGGDNNSNANLAASSTPGTVTPDTLLSKTGGHATLENCKTRGAYTLVYEYKGSAGQVTLTVGAAKAYIAYVCVIPMEKKPVDPDAGKDQTVRVTIEGSWDGADTDKVYLQNKADATDSKEVKNGEDVTLKVATTYKAVVKDSAGKEKRGLTITINDSSTLKVTTGTDRITIKVKKSDPTVPTRETTYDDFEAATGTPVVGSILPGSDKTTSGILYVAPGSSSGCSFDGALRFRQGVVLYLPILDDTTKVTFEQTCTGSGAGRHTYVGGEGSGYVLEMDQGSQTVTIDDILDLIVERNGEKYLPILSDGDVKISSIKLTEYNPVNVVTVSGKLTIPDEAKADVKEIRFANLDNENAAIVSADVQADGTYTVDLRRVAGNTKYVAAVNAVKWKINDADGKNQFTLTGNDATSTQNFTVVEQTCAKVTGKVTGIPKEAVKGGALGVAMVPDNKALDPIPLTLTEVADGYTYAEVLLAQGMTYTVKLTNAEDYEVTEEFKIPEQASYELNIAAGLKPLQNVTGKFITSDRKDTTVTKITFTNKADSNYKYTFDVTGNTYTAKLRAAEYDTIVTGATGYTAFDHVSVKDAAVENDVYLQGVADTSKVAYKETIKVGSGEGKDFSTIADAVAYIARMTRTDEQRVTIVLDEYATYREQLVIDTPNITIQGNGSTITWYYGVGFSYYSAKLSADEKFAYYDEAYAVDKYDKQAITQNPGHWGATVNLHAGAKGFAAENLTFENSLNRYVTDAELADGAAENKNAAVTARAKGIDVFAKEAKERACVLYIQADQTTYKNCNFLSEQDTIYTGDKIEHSYFVDCTIEGNTDYICGDGNAVFNRCTLSTYSYSNKETTGSFILANKKVAAHGYLLKNCEVVSVKDTGRMAVKNSYLARAWDAGYLYLINTEVESTDAIIAAGYSDMNAKVENAHYFEYNTHTPDGVAVDTSKRAKGVTIMTKADADKVVMTDSFDGWKPIYYSSADGEDVSGTGDGWDKVAAPVIGDVTYVSGDGNDKKLTVPVTANIGSKGGQSLDVTVKKDGETTAQSKTSTNRGDQHKFEFTVSGPGKYTITATLKRNGKADKTTTKKVTVNKKGQVSVSGGGEGLYVERLDDGDYTYTGSAIKPKIAVYNGDELLTEGVDYTVKYSNNVKASVNNPSNTKKPTITITGKGRFVGKTTQTFDIKQKSLDMDNDDVFVGGRSKEDANTLVVAENVKLSPILVYKGMVLKIGEKKDFTLSKDKVTKSDTTLTITGKNNYTGSRTYSLDVRAKGDFKKITTVKVDKDKAKGYSYDGIAKDVPIQEVKAGSQTLEKDDYIVVPSGDLTSAGTQKFTVIGLGIYASSKTANFKINPRKVLTFVPEVDASLKNGEVVTCEYNSAGVTFSDAITVTDTGLNNAELVLGKDYKVTYSGNKKVGTGKYTVTFLGNYKGSKTAAKNYSFSITAADLEAMTKATEPSEKEGLYLKSADKAYGGKAAVIKSAPYVLVNGVALKTSDYKVTYYVGDSPMSNSNKVSLAAGENSKTVRVEIEGKKNYKGKVETSFDVVSKEGKTDISKAKITFKDGTKKQSKVEYSGDAVYPKSVEIKVGSTTTTLKYSADTNSWVNTDGTANSDFDIVVVNNIAKGKATMIVTGAGNNVGSKTATFSVVSFNLKNVSTDFWSDIFKQSFNWLRL